MNLENWFPYKPLGVEDVLTIGQLCGGLPIRNYDQIERLIDYSARPMLERSTQIKHLMIVGAKICAQTFDIDTNRGASMFNRGALLYIALLNELSPLGEIPCDPHVFWEVANTDEVEFMSDAITRVRDETRTFYNFIYSSGEALQTKTYIDQSLVVAGAGLVHVITTDSLKREENQRLEAEFPELSQFDEQFKALDE